MSELVIDGLFSAILAALIAAVVSWLVSHYELRSQEINAIHDSVAKIIEFSITFPYLEDDNYCSSWKIAKRDNDEAMRYENYCCAVFNLLERVWAFSGGNPEKVEEVFSSKEMILRHGDWWKSDPENRRGYEKIFRQYVNQTLKNNRRKKHAVK